MENRGVRDCGEMEDEEFSEEFRCGVCLDIMYKPVALACGHISCFWCVFEAMDAYQESHCPVCRKSYNHFPRICELLHFLLLKSYPLYYKRKGKQVAEEEEGRGHTSPQFDVKSIDSQFCEVLNSQHYPSPQEAVYIQSNAMCGADHSHVQDPLKRMFRDEESTPNIPVMSSSQEASCVVEHGKQYLLADLQCAVCKQLLCRPVVLNCGHVFCEACIDPHDSAHKCPKCQSAHPNGLPNVCLALEHFMEEHFSEEYSVRKESLRNFQSANLSQGSNGKQEQAAPCSSVLTNDLSSWFSEHGPKCHPGVGCDHCGKYPIIGKRYKCRDCVEKIGFDLCESCYNSSSKLPGRFNQQHTQEHQFVVLEARFFGNIICSLGAEHPEDYEVSAVNTDNPEEVLTVPYLSNDASEDELEIASSANSLDNDPLDLQNDAMAPPNSSHNRSEDQYGDFAT